MIELILQAGERLAGEILKFACGSVLQVFFSREYINILYLRPYTRILYLTVLGSDSNVYMI